MSCSGVCTEGYYCPLGSVSAMESVCGSHSVFCPRGTGAPRIVYDGYYSGIVSVRVYLYLCVCIYVDLCGGRERASVQYHLSIYFADFLSIFSRFIGTFIPIFHFFSHSFFSTHSLTSFSI